MENEQTNHYTPGKPGDITKHRHLTSPYYFSRAKAEITIGLLSALVASWLFLDILEQDRILPILAITVVIYLARMLLTPSKESESATRESRYIVFALLLFFCGVLWGVAGATAVQLGSEAHKFGLALVIICLSFLVTLAYSGRLSLMLVFTLPALGIPAFTSYTRVIPHEPLILYTLVAVAIFLFIISIIYRRSFLAAMLAKAEYTQMHDRNETLLNHVQKLQLELKTTVENQRQAVKNLTSTTDNLERCNDSKSNLVTLLKSNIKTDPVTTLANHSSFKETLETEWQRAIRNKEALSLAYIRVDDFENFEKGQSEASVFQTLKKIGAAIKEHGRRAGDVPARLENNNFALLLLGADSKNAENILENIRKNVSLLGLPTTKSGKPVTIHAGLASLVPDRSSKPEDLYKKVESAVYEAQFQGGDRVVSFHSFDNLEVTKWNSVADGELNEANFQQKLRSLGFTTKKESIPPGTTFQNQVFSKDTLFAIFSGTFKLNIEGQDYELKKGNSLTLPGAIPFSAEVINDEPVILFLEKR